jgi:hypothetical protein
MKQKLHRKISRKGLVRKLDKLVGDIVKLRDGACVCCGSKNSLQPGHLFSRVAYSTRWDLDNVFCQCRSCNFKHEYDPYPLTNYYITKFGKGRYDALHARYVTAVPIKTFQLEVLRDTLEMILENEQEAKEKTI